MPIAKQLYVGFQNQRYENTDDQRQLGFAIPYKPGTKAFEDRKKTVDSWSDDKLATKIIDNEPMTGFRIVQVVARYKGNKLFRVADPRGFELEISAANLFENIGECLINKGEIMDQMVWIGKDLVSVKSDRYKNEIAAKKGENIQITPGTYLKNKAETMFYRYEGRFFFSDFRVRTEYAHYYGHRPSDYQYYRNRNQPEWFKTAFANKLIGEHSLSAVKYDFTVKRQNKEKIHLYTTFYSRTLDAKAQIRGSHFKDLIPMTDEEVKNLGSDVLAYETKVPGYFQSNSNVGWSGMRRLFETREEAESAEYTIEKLIEEYLASVFRPCSSYDVYPGKLEFIE